MHSSVRGSYSPCYGHSITVLHKSMIFFSVSFPISAKIAIFLCLTSRGYRLFCSSRRQSAKNITAIRFYSQDNMTDSDTGRIKKTDQAQKIRTEICRIFLIAKWHLINYTSTTYSKYVVVAGVKLKILKANHNAQKCHINGHNIAYVQHHGGCHLRLLAIFSDKYSENVVILLYFRREQQKKLWEPL